MFLCNKTCSVFTHQVQYSGCNASGIWTSLRTGNPVKNFKQILEKAKELVNECDCENADGCPKCTFTTSRCQTYNEDLDKKGAKEFFNNLELS